jgi:hydroxymethylpyrimidine pyrophosphatase-like HAD family hydrolase
MHAGHYDLEVASGVSKGSRLRTLCAELHIDLSRVIAFGDGPWWRPRATAWQ